jgi:hypothetical protein
LASLPFPSKFRELGYQTVEPQDLLASAAQTEVPSGRLQPIEELIARCNLDSTWQER